MFNLIKPKPEPVWITLDMNKVTTLEQAIAVIKLLIIARKPADARNPTIKVAESYMEMFPVLGELVKEDNDEQAR